MRHHKLDLNLLVALDALLEESSVTRAADRVFLTQSAMSNALGRLRRHFQDELIVQVGRKMVLTEKASGLRAEVRSILLRIQEVTRPVDDFEPASASRRFRIVASDYFATVVMPELHRHLAEHAPAIQLDVLPLSGRLSEELERGEVDLLIVPKIYAVKRFPLELLFKDRWVCVTWNGHALGKKKLTLANFMQMEHVVKRENHPNFPPMDERELAQQQLVRKVAVGLPQYGLLPLALVGTQRIATVQQRLARMYQEWLPLAIHPCPFKCAPLEETVQWHPVRELDAGHAWLRGLIREICKRVA